MHSHLEVMVPKIVTGIGLLAQECKFMICYKREIQLKQKILHMSKRINTENNFNSNH